MHNISFNLRTMTIWSNPVVSLFSLPRCDPIILTRTQLIPFLCQGIDSDNGTAESPWGGLLDDCRLLFQWHATIKRSMQQLQKKKLPMERVSLILITWGLQKEEGEGLAHQPHAIRNWNLRGIRVSLGWILAAKGSLLWYGCVRVPTLSAVSVFCFCR